MLNWIIRFLFVIAGFIASVFVARDALNFGIIQMIIVVILSTVIVIIIAFWPEIKKWFKTHF